MSDGKTPRPISIWRPVADGDGDTVWRRPAPTGLGDHYARRREIRRRPEPGVRRACFFGESVAAGYLYAPHLTPAQVLEGRLLEAELRRRTPAGATGGWEVLDFARTNERSASLADTVEAAAQLAPDHLVIFTGNNPKLLDTPELSPYAPSTDARRELAAALADEGPEGLARLARRRWAGELAAALERVAAVAADLGARVTLVNRGRSRGARDHDDLAAQVRCRRCAHAGTACRAALSAPVIPAVLAMTGASLVRNASKNTLSGNSSGCTRSTRPFGGPSSGSASGPLTHVERGCGAT